MSDRYRYTPSWIDEALAAYDRAVREHAAREQAEQDSAARVAEEG